MPIGNVNVVLVNSKADTIISYTSTDINGNFTIKYNNIVDSLRLDLSCIGYEGQKIFLVKSYKQNLNLQLKILIEELEEVIIEEARSIYKKGDTINYNVKSFADRTDRVIIDVIKNLPGIKITENGQILYQNKAINKFYVDGKDLLEQRYNIASNNLPVYAVDQIQVLENHQPIKMLDGVEQSDRAAINIKLNQDSRTRLLGNGNVGIGLTPFLRDNNIALLKFSKNIQYINTLKNNNVGVNLDNELNEQNFSSNLYQSNSIKSDLLSLIRTAPPPIVTTRYLFNNNTLLNSNYLVGLSSLLNLKFNFAYENDNIVNSDNTVTNIFLPADTIVINESQRGERAYHKLLTGLTLDANTTKIYLKNSLKFQRIWSNERDYIASSNISQTVNNPFINVINDLGGIINLKNNLLGINSFLSYTNLPQRLNVTPGQYNNILNNGSAYDEIIQTEQLKAFFNNNSVSFSKKFGAFNFNNKIGLLLKLQTFSNDLNLVDKGIVLKPIGNFENTIDRNLLKVYDETSLTFGKKQFSVKLGMNIDYNSLSNNGQKLKQTANEFFVNPNLYLRYAISSFWDTNLSVYSNNNVSYEANPSFILINYRSLINSDVPLYRTNNNNLNYGLSYKNIINAVFANFGASYTYSLSNILLQTQFNQALITQTAILQDNPSTNLKLSANVNKYYLKLKTSIDISLNYNVNRLKQMQQGLLTDFENKTIGLDTKINTKMSRAFSLTHNFNLLRFKSSSEQNGSKTSFDPITFLNQSLALNLFAPKAYTAKLLFEHYYNNSNNLSPVNYYFVDATLQKSFINPKLDFSINLLNVFNSKSYTGYTYTNNYLVNSNYALRGRMILFKVGFQF